MWLIINELFGYIYKKLRATRVFKTEFVFPYQEIIDIHMNEKIKFKMFSNGGDTIATSIHPDGIKAFEPEMEPRFRKLIVGSSVFF